VLDVGCGNGHHITYTTPIYEKYLGLDLDYNRLKTFTGLWGLDIACFSIKGILEI